MCIIIYVIHCVAVNNFAGRKDISVLKYQCSYKIDIHIHKLLQQRIIIIDPLCLLIIAGPYIGYLSDISQSGSGGSPILKEYNKELMVVGLHLGNMTIGGSIYIAQNGTLITVIVDHIRGKEYDESKCK